MKELDVGPVCREISKLIGQDLTNMVVYGELMCNSSLYNYHEYAPYNVFGAMIKHQDHDLVSESLIKAGFSCSIRKD